MGLTLLRQNAPTAQQGGLVDLATFHVYMAMNTQLSLNNVNAKINATVGMHATLNVLHMVHVTMDNANALKVNFKSSNQFKIPISVIKVIRVKAVMC